MERFKQICKKVFFPPSLLTIIIAVPSFALVIFVLAREMDGPIAYLSYGASAYALIISITALPRLSRFFKSVRERLSKHPVVEKISNVPLGARYLTDVRFRTEISLYRGFFINLLYIGVKMVSGILYRSVWFISLAVYYILLAVMRFLLFRRGKTKLTDDTRIAVEWQRYRLCGIVLLLMNQALAGIIVFMVYHNHGYHYPGLLVYAMAMYSFYAVIFSAVNLVRFRKYKSPALSAAKVINLVSAMVSILSLETAMVDQFGEKDLAFRRLMTGATGGGICTIVLAMAAFMIVKSTWKLKKVGTSNSEP